MIKVIAAILLTLNPIFIFSQNGVYKTRYDSGKVESRISYVDEILEGKSIWYYENGNIKIEKNYSGGKLNGVNREFYKSGLLKKETNLNNGILDGITKTYYENGGLKEVLEYDMGKLKSIKKLEYDPNYIASLEEYQVGKQKRNFDNNDFLCEVDICPEPIGGIEEIESKIIYPLLARQYKLEGPVLVTARINERGVPKKIRVVQGLGLGCDEAAIEAVKKTKFIPGEQNGEIVSSEVTFKLNFKINEPKEPPNPNLSSGMAVKNDAIVNDRKGEPIDFIICKLGNCPKPIGGITELLNNLRYPPQAKRNKIGGDVLIEATVDEFGFVMAAKVLKGIGYGCDEAAISALIKTQFEPARIDGKEVNSVIKINVPFILK